MALVAYWKLDGNSEDSVGGFDGVDTGVVYAAGMLNDAAFFDVVGDEIQTSMIANATLQPAGGVLTITAWIRPHSDGLGSGNYGRIIDKSDGASALNGLSMTMGLVTAARRCRCYFDGLSGAIAANAIPVDEWALVGWTFSDIGATLSTQMYINGVANGAPIVIAKQFSDIITAQPFMIGAWSLDNQHTFDGGIDDVRIYHNGFTTAEWLALYNSYKFLIQVAGAWKPGNLQIQIGGAWKAVQGIQVQVGGAWKTVF